jgi:hypothetical protein
MAKTRNRMYEPYGYREGEQYFSLRNAIDNEIIVNRRTDKEQDDDIDALSGNVKDLQEKVTENTNNIDNIYETAFFNASFNTGTTSIDFENNSGSVIVSVDLSEIAQLGVIKSAVYDKDTQQIIITFENGDVINIDCNDLINIDEYGAGLELIGDSKLGVKKDEASEKVIIDASGTTADVLSISDDGVKVSNIQAAIDVEKERAMEAEAAEKEERENADSDLDEKIEKEISDRIEDVDTEKERAMEAEAELADEITAEAERAKAEEDRLWSAIDAGTGSTESLLARVEALEAKMAMFEGAIKINPGLSPDDSPQSVYMFVEGDWHDVTTLLSAFTNEGF